MFTVEDFLKKVGDNPTCALTGDPIDLTKGNTYHLDHIIPSSKGGDNSLDNCQILSKDVNMAKGNLLTEDFIKLCEKVIKHHKSNKKKSK
jgi:5-methylcytosine-specific restriction endonuclease McrA